MLFPYAVNCFFLFPFSYLESHSLFAIRQSLDLPCLPAPITLDLGSDPPHSRSPVSLAPGIVEASIAEEEEEEATPGEGRRRLDEEDWQWRNVRRIRYDISGRGRRGGERKIIWTRRRRRGNDDRWKRGCYGPWAMGMARRKGRAALLSSPPSCDVSPDWLFSPSSARSAFPLVIKRPLQIENCHSAAAAADRSFSLISRVSSRPRKISFSLIMRASRAKENKAAK